MATAVWVGTGGGVKDFLDPRHSPWVIESITNAKGQGTGVTIFIE